MILIDTGAIYALNDFSDRNHHAASTQYGTYRASSRVVAVTPQVMMETWFLVKSRKNIYYADKLWEQMLGGVFVVLELNGTDLINAFDIRKKYADSGMSIVDATSLAACERYGIEEVFTFDRQHLGIYQPTFVPSLKLMP